ncbi:unnamed protein product [Brassica rapa]|uniref:Uncharacterized protein n=1 Tax=Brassica campestris TaxID=3711 RepID=A0A8D9G6F6_BRACM|nr:unnamed protein product [Brassica rapa]
MDVLPRGPKSPKQSTGRASVRSPRTNVLICELMDRHGYSPRGPKSPEQSTGRVSVQSPRTNVLICTHTDVLCVLTDTHGRPVCADGHPQMSCRTPTDVLCVLNRQPTRDKITRTVHGKGQRAESKDQCADMCTDGQPRTHRRPVCADGCTQTHTDVLCVLTDTHGRPVCADGQPLTATNVLYAHTWTATDVLCVLADTHGSPVCTDQIAHLGQNHPNSPREGSAVSALSPTTNVLICVLMDSHRRHVCSDGHKRTHTDTHGHTQTATNVLCVLTNTHGRPVYADGHPRPSCVHGRPVCADGHTRHTRTSCASCVRWRTPTNVLCVLNGQPTWAKITQTVHGKGQRAESKNQRADIRHVCSDGHKRTHTDTHGHTKTATNVLCVLTNTHGRPPWTATDSHKRPVCAGGHPQTHTDTHGPPRTSYSPRGPKSPKQSTGRASVRSPRTNVLICELMDRHGCHVCAEGHRRTHTDSHRRPMCAGGHPQTSCPTWAKITRTVHGKGQRAESKDQRAYMSTNILCMLADTHRHTRTHTDSHRRPMCADGQPQKATYVMCVLADTHGRPVHRRLVCAGGHPRTSCVY